jgi:hypothetical protein
MERMMWKLLIVVAGCLIAAGPAFAEPYFKLDTESDWQEARSGGHIYAMEPAEWSDYMSQWQNFTREGEPYPNDPFLPAKAPAGKLYVYGGGGGGGLDPNDAGLVMVWGSGAPPGNYSSAYKFDYLLDPSLVNCTITVTVTAPQLDQNGNQMNRVSLGLQDAAGAIRAWYWNCPNPIPWGVPTKITIDTSKVGVNAATPVASAYMNNPAFNLGNVQWIIVDENGAWVGGPTPAPAPGSGMIGMWNYWHWLMVTPNTTVEKGIYKKWSQPPVVIDPNADPLVIEGWDENSDYGAQPIVADDWKCTDDRPVTDIHWWGSYIGWEQPYPPQLPIAFHLGIWTDVPDPNPANPLDFSHPNVLIWENYCDNYVWDFVGYDKDPRIPHIPGKDQNEPGNDEPMDACFQFTQLLSQDEWFHQQPDPCDPNGTIYWLSIAPIWDQPRLFPWGWKTRPHYFNDDAVSMWVLPWPPVVGATMWVNNGTPLQVPAWPHPEGITWDVAFELTTNEPAYEDKPIPGDLNADKIVNLFDLAILADNWLVSAP